MADNIAITEGSGKDVATDDVGGKQYQRIKLDLGIDGAAAPALAGAGAVATGVQRITLASDDPAVALLGTIDTDTGNMVTALQLLDNAVDGAYLNVNLNMAGTDIIGGEGVITAQTQRVTIATDDDSVAHLATIAGDTTSIDGKITACNTGAVVLATGSAAIGKLAANDGIDIGNVDVTSIIPLTGATNLGKARDAVLGADDVGVMALAVRDDTLTTLTPADGDYVPLRVSSTGQLHVTGGGGGTQYNIDTVLGGAAATTLAGVVRDDSLTALTEEDGDISVLRVNSTGALYVTGGGGGTEYTEDVATANPIVGSAIMMERDDNIGPLTPIEGDWVSLRCSAEGAMWVQDINSDDILSSLAVIDDWDELDRAKVNLIAGQVGVQGAEGNVTALTQRVTLATDDDGVASLGIMDDWDAVHASAVSSDGPQVMGAAYSTALPTDVGADADAARLVTDRYGRLCAGLQPQAAKATLDNADTTTAREVVGATASRKIYVTSLIISVDTAGNYWLEDGDATAVTGKFYLAANGGVAITFPEGTPLNTVTVNKALNVKGSTSGNVSVTVTYYLAP